MDPFWIAVVSASSAVAGAFVGALPGLIESRGKRRESEKTRQAEGEKERYARAVEFVEAMTRFTAGSTWHDTVLLNLAASKFVATLRNGEVWVADFVRDRTDALRADRRAEDRLETANETADELFRYLRRDIEARQVGETRKPPDH